MMQKLKNPLLWYALLEDSVAILLLFFAFFMSIELLLPGFLSDRLPLSLVFFTLLCLLGGQIALRKRLAITLTPGTFPSFVHIFGILLFFGFFTLSNIGFGYTGIMLQVIFLILLFSIVFHSSPQT